MSFLKKTVALSVSFAVVAGLALAAGDAPGPAEQAIKARQAKMSLYAYNLGILGGMAKGEIDYDAQAAGGAAANVAALAGVYMPSAWQPGTDNVSMQGTRALPALWESGSDAGARAMALRDAATAMAAAAGTDLAGLRSTIGDVGKACGGCHKSYRAKE